MANKKISHKQRTLRHLKQFGYITPWGALREYGNTRLSATIYELKKDGVKIEKEMVNGINRFNEKIRYAKYNLIKD